MATSRADRRADRKQRAAEIFGGESDAALDLLELTDFVWHDCYGEVTPPEQVIDDVFVVAQGSVAGLARAARLALEDYRDLRLHADDVRG